MGNPVITIPPEHSARCTLFLTWYGHCLVCGWLGGRGNGRGTGKMGLHHGCPGGWTQRWMSAGRQYALGVVAVVPGAPVPPWLVE